MASGASGDLAELRRRQLPMHMAVELARAGEGDMVDVEVEPHADGVGGDKKVHVAGLIERHLGVARARAQRTQHDGCAAALAAHEFGDGVNLGRGKRDDRSPRRQARDLLLAGIGQLRQPGPRDEIGAGNEVGDRLAHGLGAEQQRLVPAAHVQKAVGEHMAALRIGRELHLVDGEEIRIRLARHGLHGAHVVARPLGLDLLFAGDEGHGIRADPRHDLVIDLAGKQAQRQADEAGLVTQHALDRQVRLAGIGRPEHGRHIADAMLEIAVHFRKALSVPSVARHRRPIRQDQGPCPIGCPDKGPLVAGRSTPKHRRTISEMGQARQAAPSELRRDGSPQPTARPNLHLNAAARSAVCRVSRSPRAWRRASRIRPAWEL